MNQADVGHLREHHSRADIIYLLGWASSRMPSDALYSKCIATVQAIRLREEGVEVDAEGNLDIEAYRWDGE